MSGTVPAPTPPATSTGTVQTRDDLIASWGRVAISIVIVLTFLIAQTLSMFHAIPESSNTSTLLTTLDNLVLMVVAYWVGSSAGSTSKSATIERQGTQLATMAPDPGAKAPP